MLHSFSSRIARVLAAAVLACSAAGASAACFPASGNYSYHGRLSDGRPVGATLTIGSRAAADVTGTVFVAPLFEDVEVVGEIEAGQELRLRSKADGSVVFDGWFLDHVEGMGPLTCDFPAGRWSDGRPAAMHLVGWGFRRDRLPAEEQRRLNAAVLDISDAVEAHDAERLAQHVRFPLTIGFPDAHGVSPTIANARSFIRQQGRIFGPNLHDALQDEVPHDPFCRDGECMLGHGVIWIDEHLKIVSLQPG